MGLGNIGDSSGNNKYDEKSYNKLLMIKKLQEDVAAELKVTDEVKTAFNSKQKNGFDYQFDAQYSAADAKGKRMLQDEKDKHELNYYFDKSNAYLEKLKKKVPGEATRIDVIIRAMNRVRDYVNFSYTFDGRLSNTEGLLTKMEKDTKEVMGGTLLNNNIKNFTNNIDNNVFDNQDAIESFDKLKNFFAAAGMGFDRMDDPEIKFICHIVQGVKNSAQKADILSAKLELQKTHDKIEELQAGDKNIIKAKAALAVELSKNKLSIDTLEEQLNEKVESVQQKYDDYKQKTDAEIEKVKERKIKDLEAKLNLSKTEGKAFLDKQSDMITKFEKQTDELQKNAEELQAKIDEVNKSIEAYQNMVIERDNYEADIKPYIEAMDELQLEEVKLEDLNDEHDKAKRDYNYYINTNLQDLEKKFLEDATKLAQIQQTSELVAQNKQLHADADFVRNFDWKTAKAEEYQKFNKIFMDFFANSADEEMVTINKAIKDLAEKGESAEQAFTFLKQKFTKENDVKSQNIADAYRNATNGMNINEIKADDLDVLQKSISDNQARFVAVKNMTPEQKDRIISAYEKSNTEIAQKNNLINTLKEKKTKIFDKLKGKYEIGNGEREDLAKAGKKYDNEIAAMKEKLPGLESQLKEYGVKLKQTQSTVAENRKKLINGKASYAANAEKYEKDIKKGEEDLEKKKQNIAEDKAVKPLIEKQQRNLEKANKILENEKQRKESFLDAVTDILQKELDKDLAKNSLLEGNKENNVLGAVDNYNRQFAWIDRGVNSELGKFQTRSNDAFDKSHNNTAFFREMIEAIDNAKTVFAKDSKATMEEKIEAMNNIKLKADAYLAEKKSQFRPFPSQMRKTRLQFAEDLKKYADSTAKDLDELKNSQLVKDVKEFVDNGPVDTKAVDYNGNVKRDLSNLQQSDYVKNAADKYIKEKAEEKANKEITDITIDFDQQKRNDKEMYPYEPEISFDGLYKESFGPNM